MPDSLHPGCVSFCHVLKDEHEIGITRAAGTAPYIVGFLDNLNQGFPSLESVMRAATARLGKRSRRFGLRLRSPTDGVQARELECAFGISYRLLGPSENNGPPTRGDPASGDHYHRR